MEIPEGVHVEVSGQTVTVKGKLGGLSKTFIIRGLKVEVAGNELTVVSPELTLKGTVEAHLRNMIEGVTSGYNKKMQIVFAHFPISLETKGKVLQIKNFLGEKLPRTSDIIGVTKIDVKGQDVVISGPSKEDVGQTVANLKAATKISKRDSRVFQDGLYPVE